MRRFSAGLLIAAFLSLPSAVVKGNVLFNPGFELGSAGGGAPLGWWKYDGCGQESWAGRSGSNGMAFWSWNAGWWGGFGQDVATNVAPGSVLTFSLWGLAETDFRSSANEAWLEIEFWTNGATAWTRQEVLTVYSGLVSRPNQWNLYTLVATNILPNVSMIKVVVGGGYFAGGDKASVNWDDAELSIAPPSGNFPVESSVASGNVFRITWACTTSLYYQVWSSEKLDGTWNLIRGMALGTGSSLAWSDAKAIGGFTSLYYKIVAISVTNSRDHDLDGLSDVAELRMGGVDPIRADTDGDQILDGSDPRPVVSNAYPVLQPLTLQSAGNFHHGSMIAATISCSDADGDAIEYRWRVGAGSFTPWQTGNGFVWIPGVQDVGARVLNVEARDPWGATSSRSQSVYVFRSPPQP